MKITSPNFGGPLAGRSASAIADHVYDEVASVSRSTGQDTTVVLSQLMIKYALHWAAVEFNDFEKSKAYINSFMGGGSFPQEIVIASLSATTDGAYMIIGGDFRSYEGAWIAALDDMSANKRLYGIDKVTFTTY